MEIENNPKLEKNFTDLMIGHIAQETQDMLPLDQGKLLQKFAKIGEVVEKYSVTFNLQSEKLGSQIPSPHLARYNNSQEIPENVLKFNTLADHTIPLKSYVDIRMSETIQKVIHSGTEVDVFVGSSDDVGRYYYHNGGYKKTAILNTRSSVNYSLYQNEKENKKL